MHILDWFSSFNVRLTELDINLYMVSSLAWPLLVLLCNQVSFFWELQ